MEEKNQPVEQTKTEPAILSALDILSAIDKGGLVEELRDELREVTAQVDRTGKAGTIAITLRIAPVTPGKIGSGTLFLEYSVNAKAPKHTPNPTVFFANEDGDLGRNDFNQLKLGGM